MTVELLDLSSVRRLLCSWLVVGEFGWTVMLSTAISSIVSYIEVQKITTALESTGLCATSLGSNWLDLGRYSVHSRQFSITVVREIDESESWYSPSYWSEMTTEKHKMADRLLLREGGGLLTPDVITNVDVSRGNSRRGKGVNTPRVWLAGWLRSQKAIHWSYGEK